MRINTINLLFKDASKNISRNATISVASIATIMSTLFILGLFVLFMLNLKIVMIGVYSQFNGLQGIDKINSGQNIPKEFLVRIKIIQWLEVIIFPILIAVIFFLIKFAMKLAIYPRLKEISIMQYLGATDWFIRLPFIFEGMIIGFLGAVSGVIALYLLYVFVFRQITSYPATMLINFINPYFIFTTLSWSFILIGIILTTIASFLVIKKFLIV
ncbi:MAG: FtsX-like permease family protein [Clostridium sp.]|uniref:FtsX-like permease family protein n=1 Tax=Clostridium sp. TaxID=1506 RepID=UPI003D6D48D3